MAMIGCPQQCGASIDCDVRDVCRGGEKGGEGRDEMKENERVGEKDVREKREWAGWKHE